MFIKQVLLIFITTFSFLSYSAATQCQHYLLNLVSNPNKMIYLNQMVKGSLRLSRTKVRFKRSMAPKKIWFYKIPIIATQNYLSAAKYVLENVSTLPLNLQTAIHLNKMLTQNLVPEEILGSPNFRLHSEYLNEAVPFNLNGPSEFYNWLKSEEAQLLMKNDPIGLAEIVHNNISALDSFPDGNGRLARLMADLVLLKAGLAPARYSDLSDYFRWGNPRSGVPRSVRKKYFRDAVHRGQVL